jgi:predicted DNA-binding transcriptional regulator AlpA
MNDTTDKKFLTTEELAERWGRSKRTLDNWRGKNVGPQPYKIVGRILYSLEEIEIYEKGSKVTFDGSRDL